MQHFVSILSIFALFLLMPGCGRVAESRFDVDAGFWREQGIDALRIEGESGAEDWVGRDSLTSEERARVHRLSEEIRLLGASFPETAKHFPLSIRVRKAAGPAHAEHGPSTGNWAELKPTSLDSPILLRHDLAHWALERALVFAAPKIAKNGKTTLRLSPALEESLPNLYAVLTSDLRVLVDSLSLKDIGPDALEVRRGSPSSSILARSFIAMLLAVSDTHEMVKLAWEVSRFSLLDRRAYLKSDEAPYLLLSSSLLLDDIGEKLPKAQRLSLERMRVRYHWTPAESLAWDAIRGSGWGANRSTWSPLVPR